MCKSRTSSRARPKKRTLRMRSCDLTTMSVNTAAHDPTTLLVMCSSAWKLTLLQPLLSPLPLTLQPSSCAATGPVRGWASQSQGVQAAG
mmetsp:Transcript_4239/g.7006  ORF Transcript_4239/g.7006 Transcript_4239/m.7006 type:complete len:89 (-) Transcript_4239:88-354(-)